MRIPHVLLLSLLARECASSDTASMWYGNVTDDSFSVRFWGKIESLIMTATGCSTSASLRIDDGPLKPWPGNMLLSAQRGVDFEYGKRWKLTATGLGPDCVVKISGGIEGTIRTLGPSGKSRITKLVIVACDRFGLNSPNSPVYRFVQDAHMWRRDVWR